ncbi:hypothetical protein QTQ03_08640 [Micromonospora sp. WMMA1363]|uniref:hypothetical protein n=1 Tax=Micromonospora sp. WMMA1363 TaxID=3053985 RepID=UPI00259CD179|nr:hypothetical protein [Micromonospora sp. WMMA1363]MDM4719645.1 hypothetical protein [Micromonospora sp. WMMA1363]
MAETAGVGPLTAQLRQIAAAGVQTTICIVASNNPVRDVERIAEHVLPAVVND